jgi:NAD+ kinase
MKAVLVIKKSRLETANEAASKLLENNSPATDGWMAAHEANLRASDSVCEVLERSRVPFDIVRNPYSAFDIGEAGIVIVAGGDGTFLAASHSVPKGVPMLGVNSDPSSSRGFFCAATKDTFEVELENAILGKGGIELMRMGVAVNGTVRSLHVLNEALLCHVHPAATTRFSINFTDRGEKRTSPQTEEGGWEKHVSSGAWIGTPAGSTGAIMSAGGDMIPIGERSVQFVSRETIQGRTRKMVSRYGITAVVRNDQAAVYMDGPYKHAALRLGDEVRFFPSEDDLSVRGLRWAR